MGHSNNNIICLKKIPFRALRVDPMHENYLKEKRDIYTALTLKMKLSAEKMEKRNGEALHSTSSYRGESDEVTKRATCASRKGTFIVFDCHGQKVEIDSSYGSRMAGVRSTRAVLRKSTNNEPFRHVASIHKDIDVRLGRKCVCLYTSSKPVVTMKSLRRILNDPRERYLREFFRNACIGNCRKNLESVMLGVIRRQKEHDERTPSNMFFSFHSSRRSLKEKRRNRTKVMVIRERKLLSMGPSHCYKSNYSTVPFTLAVVIRLSERARDDQVSEIVDFICDGRRGFCSRMRQINQITQTSSPFPNIPTEIFENPNLFRN